MVVEFLVASAKVVFVFAFLLGFAGPLTWAERRQSAMMQDRLGPNRASVFKIKLFGLLYPIADAIKALTKEDFMPAGADRLLHTVAPLFALVPAFVAFSVIPFGDVLHVGGREIPLMVSNINVGVVFVFAISALAIHGSFLAGWASNNKWSLLGGVRAAAQMVSYEVTLGLTIVGVLMVFGSLRLDEIVRAQGNLLFGFIPMWGIFVQPVGFLLFFAAAIAESKRVPFDIPEGESEVIGYFLEYSGMKFLLFFMGEFIEVVVIAGMIVSLFFGGWQIPWVSTQHLISLGGALGLQETGASILTALIQVGVFTAKVVFFCWLQLTIRWTLPRFRYDQLMRLGWKMMLPLSLVNIFVTGLVMMFV